LKKPAKTKVSAMSTGKALNILSDGRLIQRVLTPSGADRHPRGEREPRLQANMRIQIALTGLRRLSQNMGQININLLNK